MPRQICLGLSLVGIMNMVRKESELGVAKKKTNCVTVNCAENCSVFKLLGSKKQHCPLHGSFITITLESTDCLLFLN